MLLKMYRGPRKYTDVQLAQAVTTGRTMREILILLGLAPYGGNYETVRRRIAALGLGGSHLRALGKGKALGACSDAEVSRSCADLPIGRSGGGETADPPRWQSKPSGRADTANGSRHVALHGAGVEKRHDCAGGSAPTPRGVAR